MRANVSKRKWNASKPPRVQNKSTITGPAAALFDEPQQIVDDELFGSAVSSQDQMRMQILEIRLNEIFDCLIKSDPRFVRLLPINSIHRNPVDVGLAVQDTSRIHWGK